MVISIKNKILRAFTLIELLVVIAIIGILSGLIIVGMNSSIQSATIAKAQIFSSSLRDSLLADLVSEWKLDETSGTATTDTWSTNNGTLNNFVFDATDGWRSGSQCVYGGCLDFDGADDYVSLNNSVEAFGVNNFSIEGWIYFNSIPATGSFNGGGIAGTPTLAPGWQLGIDNNSVRFYTRDTVGVTTVDYSATNISLNKWHHWVGVRNGTNLYLYVDSARVSSVIGTVRDVTNTDSLRIGKCYGGTSTNGIIDNVRIYDSAMPTSYVRDQYYIGLNKLLANNVLNFLDYKYRLSNQ